MKNALTLLIITCASITVASAQAQELQGDCLQQVVYLCGDDPVSQCFANKSLWKSLNEQCHGDIRMLIEMEREGNGDFGSGLSGMDYQSVGGGFSYGGILRNGPGTDYGRLGSLADGDGIEIIEAVGEWSGGYQWYLVNSRIGEGFHWGGIFCSQEPLEGVLTTCGVGF